MEVFKSLLTELSQSLKKEIYDYYQGFYLYIVDLLEHKNVDINHPIDLDKEDRNLEIINNIVETISSALNSIGIASISMDFKDSLREEFLIVSKSGIIDFKQLLEIVGLKPIKKNLFNIILEYILDIDTEKLENLDLFDLLPKNFKSILSIFKMNFSMQDKDKEVMKALYPSLENFFDPTTLKIKDSPTSYNDNDLDILKKLQEAKEDNIEALKTPTLQEFEQNDILRKKDPSFKLSIGDYYYDLFGNLPKISNNIQNLLKIDLGNLKSIALNKPELFDLENLFYYISICRIFDLSLPFTTENIIKILKHYISGNLFSTGMYHLSNPLSNFFGLSILSELKLIKDTELVDLLDVEIFLESELKLYLPHKLILNFFTLLSLRILEKWGVILTEKKHLLSEQLNFRLISNNEKGFPLDLMCQLSIIKLLDDDTDLTWFKEKYKEDLKGLISKKGLVNDNLTDSARVLLIFKMLGIDSAEDSSVNILLNSIISKCEVFQGTNLNSMFNWSNDKWALKSELRMTFWILIVLLHYENMFDPTN